jgi:hypothetical protein
MDPGPISDIDVYRVAHELIQRFGWLDTLVATAQCIRDLAKAGDKAGVEVWGRVLDVVVETNRLTPESGQPLH